MTNLPPDVDRRIKLRGQAMTAKLQPEEIGTLTTLTRRRLLADQSIDPTVRQLTGEYLDLIDERWRTRAKAAEVFAGAMGAEVDQSTLLGGLMFAAGHDMRQKYGDEFDAMIPTEGQHPLVGAAQVVGKLAMDARGAAEAHLAEAYNELHGSIK